jgi:hypothetical protein
MEKKYEISYFRSTGKPDEVVDRDTMEDIVYELESFERDDVNQIHELEDDGSLGRTIWTEEEGLFVRDFGYDTRDDVEPDYKIYPTELLNSFNLELFSTDYRDYDSVTQNAKTDYLFECDNFDDWFTHLIETFVEDTGSNETQLMFDIQNCPDFVKNMKSEYDELKELYDED